jgi:hypothetical protein
MRMMAPAISGAAVILAAALVWYVHPDAQPPPVSDDAAAPSEPLPVTRTSAVSAASATTPAARTPSPAGGPVAAPESSAPRPFRSPLPGETPSTPMADLLAAGQKDFPPQLADYEREFAAEPVDTTWAPGAEADLLATFAQMPNLKVIDMRVECRSTTCRLELTQPSGAPDVEGGRRPFNILLDSVGLAPRQMISLGRRGEPMRSVAYLWRDGFVPERHPGQAHETD